MPTKGKPGPFGNQYTGETMEQKARRFWSRVAQPAEGCWEWPGAKTTGGYGRVRINGKDMDTHRFSYELVHGSIPDGLCVCHRCDNRACVRPDHLFLGTQQENVRDMVRKGRHPRRKLTADDARSVLLLHMRDGVTQAELARRYGASKSLISAVCTGAAWRDVYLEITGSN